MPPRKKQTELPKTVLQTGQLGCMPVSPAALSYLCQNRIDLILGYRDKPETLSFKKNITNTEDNSSDGPSSAFALENRLFNGYSDALYRGFLPQVILANPSSETLKDYIKNFMDYLVGILGMGFFLPTKYVVRRDPVEDFIPCTVLAGDGLMFSRFITALMQSMSSLSHEHPALDESTRLQILSRFVRGVESYDVQRPKADTAIAHEKASGFAMPLVEPTERFRIAGGSPQTQDIIQQVFRAHGFLVIIENQKRNPVERLEFENALWQLSTFIMPTLETMRLFSPGEVCQLASRLQNSIFEMGKRREAFNASDEPVTGWTLREEIILPEQKAAKQKKRVKDNLLTTYALQRKDISILKDLGAYAEGLGLEEEKKLFEDLVATIEAAY